MPSAKQIAWRKKFAKMSKAGKFKKSKTKISRKAQLGMGMRAYQNAKKSISHGKTNFTLAEFEKNEDINYHAENALELVKKYGTKSEIKKIEAINKRHKKEGRLAHDQWKKRVEISDKYYDRLVADSKK